MLNGKIVLITGGGRGIGEAIAISFAREGARVAVAARSGEQVNRVAEKISNEVGTEAVGLVCDVSDPRSVERMFAGVVERLGGEPNIMVNNAGIAESATLVATSDELWQRHLDINLSGTFYCTRAALPAM